MINILYVVSTLQRCGPTNQLSYIIKYLDRTKFTPIVLTLSPERGEDSMKLFFEKDLDTKVYTLGLSRIKGLFFALAALKKIIKEHKVGLIHSQGIRADGLVSKININSVATLRNYPYHDYSMTYGRFLGFLMAKIHLNYLKNINSPVVVSKSVSSMLLSLNNYKIDFIQNGVDLARFSKKTKAELRNTLKIPNNTKVFISVGHLNSRKDPMTVINAFKLANVTDSRLIFLGDGELFSQCSNIVDERIYFIGEVGNVTDYLEASDYFISASLAEGLPNTVLEAMAAKLPCILSSIPPHIELAKLTSVPPLLFKVMDVEGLRDGINNIMTLNYSGMSLASRQTIEEYLNAKKMSKQYQVKYFNLKSTNK